MILGIAVVVDELHKGQRLVFRYPESTPLGFSANTSKGMRKMYDQFFDISQDNFAKLFRPKNSLLNKVLELTIEDLHFISYPCQCSHVQDDCEIDVVSPEKEELVEITRGSSNSNAVSMSHYSLSMFNVVIVTVTGNAMHKINPDIPFKCQLKQFSQPGSDPVAAILALRDSIHGICSQTIKRVIEVLCAALCQEERRSGYVTREVSLILQLIDLHSKTPPPSASEGQLSQSSSCNSPMGGGPADLSFGLSSVSSRDLGSEDDQSLDVTLCSQSDAQNCTTAVEISAGLATISGEKTVFGVVSFDRTHRSVSNASTTSLPSALLESAAETSAATGSASSDLSITTRTSPIPEAVLDDAKLLIQERSAVPAAVTPVKGSVTSSPHTVPQSSSASEAKAVASEGSHSGKQSGWSQQLLAVVLKRSRLANELRLLFHSLAGSHSVCILCDGVLGPSVELACRDAKACEDSCGRVRRLGERSLPISALRPAVSQGSLLSNVSGHLSALQLPSHLGGRPRSSFTAMQLHLSSSGQHSGPNNIHEFAKQRGVHLESDAVLPLADTSVLLDILDTLSDHQSAAIQNSHSDSSKLRALLDVADPTLSLFDLSLALNEPVEEVVLMISHLQSLGLVEVVSLLHNQSCFQVHPLAPTHCGSMVNLAFQSLVAALMAGAEGVEAEQEERVGRAGRGNGSYNNLFSAKESRKSSSSGHHNSPTVEATQLGQHHNIRKSQSYSGNRIRADSDGNVKHATSSDRISASRGNNNSDTEQPVSHLQQRRSSGSGSRKQQGGHEEAVQSVASEGVGSVRESTPQVPRRVGAEVSTPFPLETVGPGVSAASLSAVLALFDGSRTVREVIRAMERPLQPFGVHVVIFLMRWHMLAEVTQHVLNCAKLPLFDVELLLGDGQQQSVLSSSARTPWATVSAPSDEKKSEGPQDLSVTDRSAVAVNQQLQLLTNRELAAYERLAPYIHNQTVSLRTVGEILSASQVGEAELNRLLLKLSHLRIVNRVAR